MPYLDAKFEVQNIKKEQITDCTCLAYSLHFHIEPITSYCDTLLGFSKIRLYEVFME